VRRPLLATVALSLVALLLGWETRQALQAPPARPETAAPAAWQPGVSAPDPEPAPDPTPVVAAVVARPLFRPDRLPFREQSVSAAPARNYDAELSRFTLLGVLGFGEEPVGVVTGKTGNKTDRWEVKAGDALPGFTVQEVGIEGLRLTSDGKEFLLPLYAGAPTAAAGALRTETPRRDAAQPSPAAPGATVPAKPAAPPAPAAAAPPAQPRPAYTPPSRTPPSVSPRFSPGRR
jgi:hypothetical protein